MTMEIRQASMVAGFLGHRSKVTESFHSPRSYFSPLREAMIMNCFRDVLVLGDRELLESVEVS